MMADTIVARRLCEIWRSCCGMRPAEFDVSIRKLEPVILGFFGSAEFFDHTLLLQQRSCRAFLLVVKARVDRIQKLRKPPRRTNERFLSTSKPFTIQKESIRLQTISHQINSKKIIGQH
jgi:hypothetical protein